MKTLFPIRHCPICGEALQGRKDKVFCSKSCKNEYHRNRQRQHLEFSKAIDKILHRNWVVLAELHETIGRRRFYVPMSDLLQIGFKPKYYTTTEINKKGKTYYYVYNFGWMHFSEKKVMILRLEQPK